MQSRRRGRRDDAVGRRARTGARLAVVFGLVVMVVAVISPPAGANYARIEAAGACDRTVTWRASASTEGTDDERTNNSVVVDYRATAGDDRWRSAGPEGEFTKANDFRFDGSFVLPDGVDQVEVRVRARSKWGPEEDGDDPGEPRFAKVGVPEECAGQPLVATQRLDCASGSVAVTTKNAGDSPLTAEVLVDRVTIRTMALDPGASQDLIVPTLVGRPTPISVRAGEFVASERIQGADCEVPGPSAVVLERCGASAGRLMVLATGGEQAAAADIVVRSVTVDSARIAPDSTLRRALDVPPGALPVEVQLAGQVAAAGSTGGCDGPVAGLLSCGTAGRGPCDLAATRPAPPPPPPSLVIESEGPTLPRTGPGERAAMLLIGGALIAGGGLSIAARERRRPVPSPITSALAPYRQRWWDDSSRR